MCGLFYIFLLGSIIVNNTVCVFSLAKTIRTHINTGIHNIWTLFDSYLIGNYNRFLVHMNHNIILTPSFETWNWGHGQKRKDMPTIKTFHMYTNYSLHIGYSTWKPWFHEPWKWDRYMHPTRHTCTSIIPDTKLNWYLVYSIYLPTWSQKINLYHLSMRRGRGQVMYILQRTWLSVKLKVISLISLLGSWTVVIVRSGKLPSFRSSLVQQTERWVICWNSLLLKEGSLPGLTMASRFN